MMEEIEEWTLIEITERTRRGKEINYCGYFYKCKNWLEGLSEDFYLCLEKNSVAYSEGFRFKNIVSYKVHKDCPIEEKKEK